MTNAAVWMPHAGHLIIGNKCQFHLATAINGYLISTVGEYVPDSVVRAILRRSRGRETSLRGDAEERDFGFEEIGYGRLYETMVFHATPTDEPNSCCPYRMASPVELDMGAYNTPEAAYRGHLAMVQKWGAEPNTLECEEEQHAPHPDV